MSNKTNQEQELPPIKRKQPKRKKILDETDLKIRKAKRTKLSVAAFVMLLAVGVVGNWYYENTNLSSTIQPLLTSSTTKNLGEAEFVDATTEPSKENDYFSSARLERQTARDESLEKLQSIVDNPNESDESKAQATEKIASVSSYISIENKIETLVTAKGIKSCLAVINDEGTRVDIIVDVEDLNDKVILQIKDIAMEQLGCSYQDVSIIQSN